MSFEPQPVLTIVDENNLRLVFSLKRIEGCPNKLGFYGEYDGKVFWEENSCNSSLLLSLNNWNELVAELSESGRFRLMVNNRQNPGITVDNHGSS